MPITVTMPRLSDTMQEGTLVKWRVKVGDKVKSGDLLADVETDKATMELQAFDDGTVAHLAVPEGQTTKVGGLILVLAEKNESIQDAAKAAGASASAAPTTAPKPAAKTPVAPAKPMTSSPAPRPAPAVALRDDADDLSGAGANVRVSPLARKLAQEHGVDVATLAGSGPGGRVIKRDILEAAGITLPASGGITVAPPPISRLQPAPHTPTPILTPGLTPGPAPKLEAKTIALSNMRKTIARRLVESKTTIPHFTVTVTVDMDALLAMRETLNQHLASQGVKLSVNDFVIRAAAIALSHHPVVNASWSDEGIIQHGVVNVGVGVALPEEKGGGLVVPTIRDALHKSVTSISLEARALAEKARTKGLSVDEMSDGTFTISNMGMYGVDHFEAIINPPQAAILAVGSAAQKPIVRNNQLAIGHEMTCTLSGDHRVIDGATAALFLQTLKKLLENPAVLLV